MVAYSCTAVPVATEIMIKFLDDTAARRGADQRLSYNSFLLYIDVYIAASIMDQEIGHRFSAFGDD